MDYKVKKTAIAVAVCVILLAAIVVLLTNDPIRLNRPGTSTEPPVATSAQNTQATEAIPEGSGQIGNDLSAFMKDSTFFDPERDYLSELMEDKENYLTMVVTSVEKDLRIQVVDAQGEPVTGQSFFITLKDVGDYKDLDKDGIVYVADLDAGDYYVSLHPIDGYKVPLNETKVRVKDKVEFVPIEDITLLIKTEDEVDAKAEDSKIPEAALESAGDESAINKLHHGTGKTKAGIDVSKWNGDINWDLAVSDGVEFAIVRAGYRGSVTGSLVEDPYFEKNMAEAAAAGIPVGVYFFTQAINQVEAVEEASMVIELMKKYKVDLPVFIDTEGAGENARAKDLDVETRTSVCDAFCATIQNAGYTAGVYASRNWYQTMLNTPVLEKYFIWLAEYREVPLYEGYYGMWQHSSKGQINGIKGNVDLDILYE